MRGKECEAYRRSTSSGTRGVCLNFDASPVRLFSADRVCVGEDVLVRLVKLVDFSGCRRISAPRATLPNSPDGVIPFFTWIREIVFRICRYERALLFFDKEVSGP